MNVEPHDDISTFLSHIRRAADDAASSPSRGHTIDPDDDTPVVNVDITSTVDITADIDDAAMAVDQGTDARLNSDTSVVPVGQQRQRKRKCSPAKLDRQQRRKYGSMVDKT